MDYIKMAQDCGPIVGSCKHGKRISGFNKSRKFVQLAETFSFSGKPFTKKLVVFFSSISSTFTGHNCFPLYLTAQAETQTTHSAWHLWFSGISHTAKSQNSEDLFYTTEEARNHTSYMHLVVNKVLARNGMMASSFIPHDPFCITSSIHKLTQHCKMKAQSTTIPPDTHSYLTCHLITCPVDTARQSKA